MCRPQFTGAQLEAKTLFHSIACAQRQEAETCIEPTTAHAATINKAADKGPWKTERPTFPPLPSFMTTWWTP